MKTMSGKKVLAALLFALVLPASLTITADAAPLVPAGAPMAPVGGHLLPPPVPLFVAHAAPGAAASPVAQAATVEGTWSTRAREREGGQRIQLSLEIDRARGNWNMGFGVEPGELEGLSFDQASGTVADARFTMARDAGTIAFDGSIRDGRGAGTFAFTPNASWIQAMDGLGYDDLSDEQVFTAAVHDITTSFVQDLRQLGYTDLPTGDLFSFAIHGVTPEMIRELNGLGYRDIPARQLVALRIHGASPEWIREVRAAMGG